MSTETSILIAEDNPKDFEFLEQLIRRFDFPCHLERAPNGQVALEIALKSETPLVVSDIQMPELNGIEFARALWERAHAPYARFRVGAALRAALAEGTVDIVCSDHTPVDDDGKQVPFGESEPGATGLELLLPLALKWAAEERIVLPAVLARLTTIPAAILGLDSGHLAVGQPADVCVFDPHVHWRVEPTAWRCWGRRCAGGGSARSGPAGGREPSSCSGAARSPTSRSATRRRSASSTSASPRDSPKDWAT